MILYGTGEKKSRLTENGRSSSNISIYSFMLKALTSSVILLKLENITLPRPVKVSSLYVFYHVTGPTDYI